MGQETETLTTVEEPVKEVTTVTETSEKLPEDTATEESSSTEAQPEKTTQVDESSKTEEETHDIRRMKKFINRAVAAETELQALKAQLNKQPVQQVQAPSREQFKSDAEYLAAAVQFEVQRQLPVFQQSTTSQQSADEVKKLYKDYDEVMLDADSVTIPDVTVKAVTQSPLFEHLKYHLAKHPEQAQALWKMAPDRAIAEIGKIEARLELNLQAPKTKIEVSKAKTPITPVRTSTETGKVDPDKLSDKDWWKREIELKKQKIAKSLKG